MHRALGPSVFSFCMLAALSAHAEPFVVSTTVETSGWFDCRSTLACSGEGTNAITFGSGTNTATLTFTGIHSTFNVTNSLSQVTLGTFELTASEGFTFPTHPFSPVQPILRFFWTAHESTPESHTAQRLWEFGPGGRATLPIQVGPSYLSFAGIPGQDGTNYTHIVYSFNPFPFTLSVGSNALTADAGVVPEPTSMLLLGTGLAGAIASRRRRSKNR